MRNFMECKIDSTIGMAFQTIKRLPLNALLARPEGNDCGWYIWTGEYSDAPGFFQSISIEHFSDYVPTLLPDPGFVPGWRVLLANGFEGV